MSTASLPDPSRVAAIVVAAGRGERLAAPAKVLIPLAGRPMLAWSLAALERAGTIGSIIIVAGDHTRDAVARLVRDEGFQRVQAIVAGGERRQDSVAAGLAALPEATEIVVIHDGARPLADPALFDRAAQAAAEHGAAIAAIPVADTLKRVQNGQITATVDRRSLWAAQTPQAFRLETLHRAIAVSAGEDVTDEAFLCESAGFPVHVVPSSMENLKVTHAADIPVADSLLHARHGMTRYVVPRVGFGVDVHSFQDKKDPHKRRLMLGGVDVPHEVGLIGHSDADVLLHAISDALLGAAALGDIGTYFPPTDEQFRNADSLELLREVVRLVRDAGWIPSNVDATVLAEAPRINPYVLAMRKRIAACLGIGADAVGIKATTNEGIGAIGRGLGIAAMATVNIISSSQAH